MTPDGDKNQVNLKRVKFLVRFSAVFVTMIFVFILFISPSRYGSNMLPDNLFELLLLLLVSFILAVYMVLQMEKK